MRRRVTVVHLSGLESLLVVKRLACRSALALADDDDAALPVAEVAAAADRRLDAIVASH